MRSNKWKTGKADPKAGTLRYDALRFAEEELGLTLTESASWSAWKDVLDYLESRFVPKTPSVRDQAALMVEIATLSSPGEKPDATYTIMGAAALLAGTLGITLQPAPALRFFSDSPEAGDPMCICSFCGERIGEEEGAAIRLFDHRNHEARLHEGCFHKAQSYSLLEDTELKDA